jgi:hypothetical protein
MFARHRRDGGSALWRFLWFLWFRKICKKVVLGTLKGGFLTLNRLRLLGGGLLWQGWRAAASAPQGNGAMDASTALRLIKSGWFRPLNAAGAIAARWPYPKSKVAQLTTSETD